VGGKRRRGEAPSVFSNPLPFAAEKKRGELACSISTGRGGGRENPSLRFSIEKGLKTSK